MTYFPWKYVLPSYTLSSFLWHYTKALPFSLLLDMLQHYFLKLRNSIHFWRTMLVMKQLWILLHYITEQACALCVFSWSRAIQRRWWRSTPPASTSCPSLTSCWMTLGNLTRGLASSSALSVSSARHTPTSRWRTGSQGKYLHPHAETQHPNYLSTCQAKKKTFLFFCSREDLLELGEKEHP